MKKVLIFLFSLLTFFSSCDTNVDMPQNMAAGYGKVVVTINGASARTVFPLMEFAKYEYLFAKVVNGTPGTPQAQAPVDGHFTLELGDWQVTVKAYAKVNDTDPAATGVSATFTVTGSAVAQAAVSLNGNALSGEGKFVYVITYPPGAAISVFSLKNLRDENAAVIDINAGGVSPLSGNISVSAGYYFLTIQLTESGGGRTTGANEVVYIYDRLDSEYQKTFSADDFSHIHDWNESYTTIAAATETMNGIEAITCKHDPSHAKSPRFNGEYATGTAGLAYEFINSNNTEYSVSGGTATGAIHIPAYRLYNGNYLPVTEISSSDHGSSAFGGTQDSPNTTITSVTFAAESQLTTIGVNAFSYCSSLAGGIEIPAGVTTIGGSAFGFCSSLTSVNIPAGVTTIGPEAFGFCRSLTSVTFAAGSQLQTIAGFIGCTSLTSIEIPVGVTAIGIQTFSGCSSLTSIEIPVGVTAIGIQTFSGCSSLTSITIPAGVTTIGNYAFRGCTGLTSVTFAAGSQLTSIAEEAFYDCSSLTSVNIPAGVMTIGDYAFSYCSSLSSVEIPSSVTSIGGRAFGFCSSLTSITIPAGVLSIGDRAFVYCTSFASITVDVNNPNYASQDGVLYNKAKTSILLVPAKISGNITIPSSVTTIGDSAFADCSGLTSVFISASVTTIGDYAFRGCTSLTGITVDVGNPAYASEGGILYNKTKTEIIAFPSASGIVTISAGVTSIGLGAFWNCTSLTGVNIPAGVTSIGLDAFVNCTSLTGVNIPAGVTSIGEWAFRGCTSLTSITFAAGSQLTSIAEYAFGYCTSLTSVNIPAGVTTIGEYAFSYCSSLASVIIGEGVTSIGTSAFLLCSSLTSVIIPAGVLSIGHGMFAECSSLTSVICLPTTPPSTGETMFFNTHASLVIKVPSASVNAYKSASGWSEYASRISGIE